MKMKKYFRIHENDAGTEAHTDEYVAHLEGEVERLRGVLTEIWAELRGARLARKRRYEAAGEKETKS